MPIIVVGLSHRSSPVAVRERFAFNDAEIPGAIAELRRNGAVEEAVILSTCNRVEIYAATSLDAAAACSELKRFLQASRQSEPLEDELYAIEEPSSVRHLFRVACGLDSMVLGETEILGQLKKAYELALRHGQTGSRLNRAFQRAFNVSKQIRTETTIQRGSISVGSVAVELAEKIFSSLDGRRVMVVGAGDTSEKTARALASRGARGILVANRSPERAEELAREFGGRAVPFDAWASEFHAVDIVISSTAAPHHVIRRAMLEPVMKARRNRPLLLIDIAVPRDIDPEVNMMPDVYLYNIDDLQAIAGNYLEQRKAEIARCESIIQEKVESLLSGRDVAGLGEAPRPAFGHE